MTFRLALAQLICGMGLITGVAGCAQGNLPGAISTGSILPSLPSLSTSSTPRKPERIGVNLYRVTVSDRRFDDPIQRENYALLRAAETAKAAGASHFIVVNASQPGATAEIPTMIRVLQLEPGAEPPIGAVSADEIIHFFGPNFARTSQPAPPA